MFKATDAGTNWTKLTNTPDACTATSARSALRHDPFEWTPTMRTQFFYGGPRVRVTTRSSFRTSDGGANWTQRRERRWAYEIAVDLHALAFSVPPTVDRLYIGSDGGPTAPTIHGYSAASIDTRLDSTLAITMYYPDILRTDRMRSVGFGGSQDNGFAPLQRATWLGTS